MGVGTAEGPVIAFDKGGGALDEDLRVRKVGNVASGYEFRFGERPPQDLPSEFLRRATIEVEQLYAGPHSGTAEGVPSLRPGFSYARHFARRGLL